MIVENQQQQPQTEEERFAAETAEFHQPGAAADGDNGKPAGNGDTGGNADDATAKAKDAPKGDDPAAAADADKSRTAGDAPKIGDDPKAGEGEGGEEGEPPQEGELPAWMKKRLERANRQETAAEARAREAEERARALEEENANLRAKATPAKEPDPDDFDTQAEYDDAKAAWQKAKDAPAPKAPEKKADETPSNPLGITREEIVDGVKTLEANLPPTVAARLKDAEQVKFFPATVLLEVADEADPATQTAMARFVIGNQKRMEAIGKMPPRQQAAAFIRAFNETTPAAAKKVSAAPKPIDPVNGNNQRDEHTALPSLSAASFEEFEKIMNEEDRKARGRAY